jgi:hypothetical protein
MDASHLIDKAQFTHSVKGFREHKQSFNAIGEAKVSALLGLVDAGLDVLLSDVDVVWTGNPVEYLASGHLALVDVAVTSDCIFTFEPERPEVDAFGQYPEPTRAEFNTGVLLIRATPAGRGFVARWAAAQRTSDDIKLHDQSHFNIVINNGRKPVEGFVKKEEMRTDREAFPEEWRKGLRPRYFETNRGGDFGAAAAEGFRRRHEALGAHVILRDVHPGVLRVALLPTGRFPNGHAQFVSHMPARTGTPPLAVHNTYQYSGGVGKVARFREAGMWNVDGPEYFGVAGDESKGTNSGTDGFIMLRYTIPPHLADPGGALHVESS